MVARHFEDGVGRGKRNGINRSRAMQLDTEKLLEREQDIKETWVNKLVRRDGSVAYGLLRWPSEQSAKSQADTIHWGDAVLSEQGRFFVQPFDVIEQVKL